MLEHFLRLRDLGIVPYSRMIVLAHSYFLPNYTLLRRIAESHKDVHLILHHSVNYLAEMFDALQTHPVLIKTTTGETIDTNTVSDRSSWLGATSNLVPTGFVPNRVVEEGERTLRRLGINSDDKVVCIHVRFGSSGAGRGLANSDIKSYLPAIKKLTQSGYWVIRMGDPSMPPLPSMDRVVDYARSLHRAPWLDFYLWTRAEFAIGTVSGGSEAFGLFNTPIIFTNTTQINKYMFACKSFFLPKLFRRRGSPLPMTIEEVVHSPWGWSEATKHQGWNDIEVIENTSDDICAAVDEMEQFLLSGSQFLPMSSQQEKLLSLRSQVGRTERSVISKTFVERHSYLFP